MEKVVALRRLKETMMSIGIEDRWAVTGSLGLNLLGFQLSEEETAGDIDIVIATHDQEQVKKIKQRLNTLALATGEETPNSKYKNPPIKFNLTYKTQDEVETVRVDCFVGIAESVLEHRRVFVNDERHICGEIPVMGVIYNLRQKFHLGRKKDQDYKSDVLSYLASMK